MANSIHRFLSFAELEIYSFIKEKLSQKKISISQIIFQLSSKPLLFNANPVLRKQIVHLIVKFESNPEVLKTHLVTLKGLVDEKTHQTLVSCYFKRCLIEKRTGVISFLNELLEYDYQVLFQEIPFLLHHAAKAKNAEVIKYYLKNQLPIDLLDVDHNTPLLLVAEDMQCASLLIQAKANLHAVNKKGENLFYRAVWYGNLELMKFCVEHKVSIHLDSEQLGELLNQLMGERQWDAISYFISFYEILPFLKQLKEIHEELMMQFFSYCLRKKETSHKEATLVDLLKAKVLHLDSAEEWKDYFFYDLARCQDAPSTLPFLKYVGMRKCLHVLGAELHENCLKPLFIGCIYYEENPELYLEEFFKSGFSCFNLNTALLIALKFGKERLVLWCLSKGAKLNAVISLFEFFQYEHDERRGKDEVWEELSQACTSFSTTAFSMACLSSRPNLMQLVLDRGAQIDAMPLLRLYTQDLKDKTTRCDNLVALLAHRDFHELLELSLYILKHSFEEKPDRKTELEQEIDCFIALTTSTPEKKQKFLKNSFNWNILFQYLLAHYLDDLDNCFRERAVTHLSGKGQELPLLTPSEISQYEVTIKELIPFEGKLYTLEDLLDYGYETYLDLRPEFISIPEARKLLRAIPPHLLAGAVNAKIPSKVLLREYLPFCEEAQLRVIIPSLRQSYTDLLIKQSNRLQIAEVSPIAFQLACLKAATPSQKRSFLAEPKLCNLSSQLEIFKQDLQKLEKNLLAFAQICRDLALEKSEEKYDQLAAASSENDILERNLRTRMQFWKNLLEALNSRERTPSIVDLFAQDEQIKALELLAKKEELFQEKERLFAEKNKLLIKEDLNSEGIPNAFICPISEEVMENPVTTRAGHTYERASITYWIQTGNGTDPLNPAAILTLSDLKPNNELKDAIEAWRKIHKK